MNALPRLETDSFIAWFADNRGLGIHAAGYNGVAALTPRRSGNNLFSPFLAGCNYELFSLRGLGPYPHPSGSRFEPRCEPMHIEHADNEHVVMVQPETSHSRISVRTTFSVAGPCYLEKHVELTAHRRFCNDDEANRLVVLCANYMHAPPDRHVYLKTDPTSAALTDWVGVTQEDHAAPTYQVYRLPDDREIGAEEHREVIAGSLAPHDHWPRKSDRPLRFFYGFCHGDQMLLMMFKQPEYFRLSYSPNAGGSHPRWNPAWDYVLTHPDIKPGVAHHWDLRLVVKPFINRRDVLEEVARYAAS